MHFAVPFSLKPDFINKYISSGRTLYWYGLIGRPATELMQMDMRQSALAAGLHILCSGVVSSHAVFLFAVVRVGGLGLLGERWPSILSGCLMDQVISTDNVKSCEGGGWRFLCQTGGT